MSERMPSRREIIEAIERGDSTLQDVQRDILEAIIRNNALIWSPPLRSIRTGHRIALAGYQPVETRKLGWRWWLAEIPMRILARSMAKDNLPAWRITGDEEV
jgi:hypothetical protein